MTDNNSRSNPEQGQGREARGRGRGSRGRNQFGGRGPGNPSGRTQSRGDGRGPRGGPGRGLSAGQDVGLTPDPPINDGRANSSSQRAPRQDQSLSGRGREGRGRTASGRGRGSKKPQSDEKKPLESLGGDGKLDRGGTNNENRERNKDSSNDAGRAADRKASSRAQQRRIEGENQHGKPSKKGSSTSTAPHSAPLIPPQQPQLTNDINYGKGEKITVLHIAEKPSIAQAIAKGLCSGKSEYRGSALPVHEFVDNGFPKAPFAKQCRHCVTSVAGHVFSVDFPPQFQSWDSVDPAELFRAPVVKKPNKGSVVKHLQDEARGVDFIVLWMDCDREGENINFEVLDCCMHLMKRVDGHSNYDRVYRAHFSAINPSDIKKAYNSLGKPDKNQALAVDARQELDLKVGVAFSRFQTRFFQGRYGDLDSAVLSYGPCQTPTLGFCVQRYVDIETFKPEPYWMLDLGVLKRGRILRATWGSGRSFNKSKVEGLVAKCLEPSANPVTVQVTNVATREKKQGRPIPLNTVALLKACSKALGIGPQAAMQTAERLYLSGYLSYPRTESSTYPKSFDIRGTLEQQISDNRWGSYVRDLLHNEKTTLKSRGGVDMGDHPPITPCIATRAGELSGDMERVYDLVVRHFIASVSQDAVWRATRVDFVIEALEKDGHFSVSGKELVDPGFLAVLLHNEYGDEGEATEGLLQVDEDEEVRTIPEFIKGEIVPIFKEKSSSGSTKVAVAAGVPCWASLGIKEKMTTPPTYLTESELIGKMESNGIGTDASIATHIQNIQNRNYAGLESGRRLVPSKLGLILCQGYHLIDSGLVLPKIRSDIEDQCSKIAKGLANRDDVVRRAIEFFHDKFQFFIKNIDKMDMLFGSSFAKLEDVGKPFTRCGLSNRYLQFIPGPPQRLYNKYTETVYPLPAGGIVKQWTGRKCSVPGCNFELCLYTCGQPPRTFPLCPNCFNKPEWSLNTHDIEGEDPIDKMDAHKERQIQKVAGKQLVLECPLPDHHPVIVDLTVSPDPDSGGVLILDPHFGPKWRLVSTRDPTIVQLPKSIEKITIMNKLEESLGCHYMNIDFKAGETPLEGGATNYKCCFPTDELMQGISRVFHGSERTKAPSRGGRGRGGGGRGRGRGGRRVY